MSFKKTDYDGLRYVKTKDLITSAIERLSDERTTEQFGVLSRFSNLNRAMLKYFRFGKVVMLFGMSGSGKSYLINMLRNDFLSHQNVNFGRTNFYHGNQVIDLELIDGIYRLPTKTDYESAGQLYIESGLIVNNDGQTIWQGLNRNCIHDVVWIHFGFEMDGESELIRSAANVMGTSYGFLMSSEYDAKINDYRRLNESEFAEVKSVLNAFAGRKEYYVPVSGNVEQMKATCYKIAADNPTCKIGISLDHTLLSLYLKERDEASLQKAIALMAIELKQRLNALVILVNQMNQNIEADDRINSKSGHYPTKKDIHLGAQIWWACDTVIAAHRPIVLGIKEYGPNKLRTDNLIHGAIIKNRDGVTGDIFLREDFAHGRIHQATQQQFIIK